ncbi:hypothetical protein JTB14_009813 [Gonioctena quinquepunctata]|nr:hypothetical protein JTB14_009813 [Gonioctena quinquepunctata]
MLPVRLIKKVDPLNLKDAIRYDFRCLKFISLNVDDIEEEETDTILEQINDEIENEEDHDETDDPIVDDAEETSVFDISIGIEDDENPTPGPSTRMKRRKLN